MASTLTVDNIVGATSASNIHIPGHCVAIYHHTRDPGTQSTVSTTLVETGLTITLTPKSVNNKFLLWASMQECYVGASQKAIGIAFAKNGSRLYDTDSATLGYTAAGGANYINVNLHAMDTPATISSITYSVMVKSVYGDSVGWHGDNTPAFFTVMEIAQ